MKEGSYQQFAIVQGDTAEQLTDRLNAKLYELRYKDPAVSFDGLIARISYYEKDPINESPASFKNFGINFKCKECPYFEPLRKRDGTPDRRTSFGLCRFAPEGQTIGSARACDKLYEMIIDREVKLCLAD